MQELEKILISRFKELNAQGNNIMFISDVISEIRRICKKHEKEDSWIPVEKWLPEEPKENPEFEGKKIELYLVTVKGTKYPFRAFWNGKQFTDGWSVLDVIAWHPLPETYRAERSGK